MRVIRIPNQRDVIDRRRLTEAISAIVEDKGVSVGRQDVVAQLRAALTDGREEIDRRLCLKPYAGHDAAHAQAFLTDQLLRIIHDHVVTHVYPVGNRSTGERLAILV